MPTAKEIVIDYLKANGYDGLYSTSRFCDECVCLLADFEPCGEVLEDCAPGYRNDCETCVCITKDATEHKCPYGWTSECTGGYDYIVSSEKCWKGA